MVREERRHLVAVLEPLLARVAEALEVRLERLRREAEQDVVRLGVLLQEEVRVVGGDDLDPELRAEREDLGVHARLVLEEAAALLVEEDALRAVEHHLEVVVLAEDTFVPLKTIQN